MRVRMAVDQQSDLWQFVKTLRRVALDALCDNNDEDKNLLCHKVAGCINLCVSRGKHALAARIRAKYLYLSK